MKKFITIIALILVGTSSVFGQYKLKNQEDINWYTNIPQEKIFVDINNQTLLSGESLYYKVYCKNARTNRFSVNSKIAYVELIGQQGSVFKHKIRLDKGIGQGDFFLPTTINTGSYKLIAYTQWMKNGLGEHFFQSDISIINPYAPINFDETAEVLARPTSTSTNVTNQVKLDVNSSYNTRDEVSLSITSINGANSFGEYSISVRKLDELNLTDNLFTSVSYNDLYKNIINTPREVGDVMFLPEINGEMITGKVINKTSKLPATKVEVALSILSDEAFQDIVLTDSNGVFYFQLKGDYSNPLAMVQVVAENRDDYQISVNEHTSISYDNLTFNSLKIPVALKENIMSRSVHNQIQNAYKEVKQSTIIDPEYPKPLYGNYISTVVLDDYKRFPTVAESLIEVVDHAWHERRNGKQRAINVRERENSPYYEVDLLPMVLVDGALVQDHENVLYYDAKNVESISVSRDEYYYGDRVYQGALLVNTFNKDFYKSISGDYASTINLFTPQLKTKYFQQEYSDEQNSKRIPDFRSQLLWLPQLSLKSQREDIIFYTSDNKGTYVVSLEGFTNKGVPVSIKKTFTVN